MLDINAAAQKYADMTLENRHYLHMHPEVGLTEENTSRYVREQLTAMGIPFFIAAKYGTVGTIGGKKPGKTVLLRADMDALPVTEENDCDYKSQNPGVMHACGHDSHTAMLLTACRILKDMEDEINGTVKVCFQLSEENGKGAIAMLSENNFMDDVDGCFALHFWTDVKSGQVSANAGPVMASADKFEITVKGKQSHGAAPHMGVDALTTACEIVTALQTVVAREIDPQDAAVITVSSFHAGTTWNIVTDTAKLLGTTRCFSKEVYEKLPEAMDRIIKGIAAAHRCEAEMEYTRIAIPTVNDEALSELAKKAIVKTFGEGSIGNMKPTTGGEDFAIYQQHAPGVICMVGCYNPEIDSIYPNHHPKFKVDEKEMVKGAGLYVQLAVDFLNS